MKHIFFTDKKYKWGALFLLVLIILFYWSSFVYNNFVFANWFTGIMVALTIVAYFKLRK